MNNQNLYAILAVPGDYLAAGRADLPGWKQDMEMMEKALVEGLSFPAQQIRKLGRDGRCGVRDFVRERGSASCLFFRSRQRGESLLQRCAAGSAEPDRSSGRDPGSCQDPDPGLLPCGDFPDRGSGCPDHGGSAGRFHRPWHFCTGFHRGRGEGRHRRPGQSVHLSADFRHVFPPSGPQGQDLPAGDLSGDHPPFRDEQPGSLRHPSASGLAFCYGRYRLFQDKPLETVEGPGIPRGRTGLPDLQGHAPQYDKDQTAGSFHQYRPQNGRYGIGGGHGPYRCHDSGPACLCRQQDRPDPPGPEDRGPLVLFWHG